MSRPAAPGSLFLVCLPPDSKTIGVPHPEPGRGRRRGGNRGSVVLLCLCSLERGPCGPGCWGQANTSPLHTPGPWATPTLLCLGPPSGPGILESKALRPSDSPSAVVGKRPRRGSHLALAACRSHSGKPSTQPFFP